MLQAHVFTVNPFQENSTVVYAETGECAIIDPGFSNEKERLGLLDFLDAKKLNPVMLINTHCHIDHVLGNRFVADKFKLKLQMHKDDLPLLKAVPQYAHLYGIDYDPSPEPGTFLSEGDEIELAGEKLSVLHVPGHAPGHIVLVHEKGKWIIGGDVLFQGSIGRTDLPGGNHEQLLDSIRKKIFTLPDDYAVIPGHGPLTNVGTERKTNPFFS
ncbi:MAG: MBL fold metallo-hydrolase [Cryomorphaceae bacterium]|nr:MAG: MBL fold metallo-hydrolase [Cryomorphaceae bacterium]